MSGSSEFLKGLLAARLSPASLAWLDGATRDIAKLSPGPSVRFATLVSEASRAVPKGPLAPKADDLSHAHETLPGWNPERWSLLDAARAMLVLSRCDLAQDSCVIGLEDCFRYADMGELVSLHRTLCLAPNPRRFAWRAGEGCRSSMRVVYEAAACDTPLPFTCFDDLAWRQLAIKAVFVGAPLWRVYGLDERLDEELARMALDLVEERRAAGRRVQPELWLCVGPHGGARAAASLARELAGDFAAGRGAAALAMSRAGNVTPVRAALVNERDAIARSVMESALAGRHDQRAFAALHGLE